MLGFPFLEELFTNILAQSIQIKGRFYICPNWGAEINSNTLDQIVDNTVPKEPNYKFPLAIMMPPTISGTFSNPVRIKRDYMFQLLFLTGSDNTASNEIKSADYDNISSTHTVVQDWHDMERVAENFVLMLANLIRDKGLGQYFIINEKVPQRISMVSSIGNDKLSGVMLTLNAKVFPGCMIEDYPNGAINNIVISTTDSHPSHDPNA